MTARDQIKNDITAYAEKHNLGLEESIKDILKFAPTATLDEMPKEYPLVAKAWQILQIAEGSHLCYFKSKEAGEFIYDDRMFSIMAPDYVLYNIHCLLPIYLPEGLKSTKNMFLGLDLSNGFSLGDNFDTSSITNMSGMFSDCILPIGFTLGRKFNTSNVTDMSRMFKNCKLPYGFSLGSQFDTSKITDMQSMFFDCSLIWKECSMVPKFL